MIYLDNAATSWPKPEEVYRAMDEFARRFAGNPGRSGHRLAVESEKHVQDARAAVARLLNCRPENIVFTLNATDALNIAIKGVVREGMHVITSETEHNSVNRPLVRLAGEGFITLTKLRPNGAGVVEPDEFRRAMTPKTKLLVITHCSNVLGVVNPIEEYVALARERGIVTIVDASQSVGVVDIDVQKTQVDLLAAPGHKNLFGPMGTGILYVRPGVSVRFFREGGTGFNSEIELHPEAMPYRLEGGTPNAHGLAGLGAGVRFVLEKSPRVIREHERRLALSFAARVREIKGVTVYSARDPQRQIGPVSIRIENVSPAEVGAIMDQKFEIACRPGLHCAPGTHRFLGTFPEGTVRFSFGWFNSEEDVEAAADAVARIAAEF